MVLEYMDHDLSALVKCPGVNFTVPQIKCYMKQLLTGLKYCHDNRVLHRDIKGANTLLLFTVLIEMLLIYWIKCWCLIRPRICTKKALAAAYFWTEPLPSDPKSLPFYESSHDVKIKQKQQKQMREEEKAAKEEIMQPSM